MWAPSSIYKGLPLLYGLIGLLLIVCFGLSGIGTFSAGLFMTAAVLTAMWRYQHRDAPPKAADIAKAAWEERRIRQSERMPL